MEIRPLGPVCLLSGGSVARGIKKNISAMETQNIDDVNDVNNDSPLPL